MDYYEVKDIEEYVSEQIKASEWYTRERMEVFDVKWHVWLKNAIEDALRSLGKLIDQNLVTQLMHRILERMK